MIDVHAILKLAEAYESYRSFAGSSGSDARSNPSSRGTVDQDSAERIADAAERLSRAAGQSADASDALTSAARKLTDAAERLIVAAAGLIGLGKSVRKPERQPPETPERGNGQRPVNQAFDKLFEEMLSRAAGRMKTAIGSGNAGGVAGEGSAIALRDGGFLIPAGSRGGGLVPGGEIPVRAGGAAAGAEGAATGGLGGLAGPVAIALIVDQVAGKLIHGQGEKIRGAIQGATGAYKQAVNGDIEGLAKGGSEKVAGFLEKTGIGGKVAAEQVRTATALVFAFKDLYDATKQAAESQHQHNMRLAEASAAMAVVEAQADVRNTFRNMEEGNRTAGTAGGLSNSLQDLADNTKEIRILFDNVKNGVLSKLVDVASTVVKPINELAGIADYFRKLFETKEQREKREREEKEGQFAFGDIMEQASRIEAESRRHNDDWFRHATDFGRQRRDERP